jgi:hypothetical protein
LHIKNGVKCPETGPGTFLRNSKKTYSVRPFVADKKVMGMIDRYKKKGGFIQLLILIETSGKAKQDQFLNLVAQESKAWEEGIRKRMLSLDRILNWDTQARAEIFSRVQPLTLATVLHGMPPAKVETILSCLGTSDKRKIMNVMTERTPTPAEKSTCIMKIVTEVRNFCNGGVIKLEKVDPEIAIPENIEEALNQAQLSGTLTMSTEPTKEEGLVFPDFDKKGGAKPATGAKPAAAGVAAPAGADRSEEVDFLKKKVNQLVQENNALKHELNVARGKLDQIKKIA